MLYREIYEDCGFNNAYDMLWTFLDDLQIKALSQDLMNSPEDAVDFITELIKELAAEYFDWVDRDELIAKAEDMEYLNFRDGDD